MVLKIAAMYGERIDKERAVELAGLVVLGFGFRGLGRRLGSLRPRARDRHEDGHGLHRHHRCRPGRRRLLRARGSCLDQQGDRAGGLDEALREPRYDSAFEAILAGIRQPARLIGEEAGAGPGFAGDPAELRVVLGFPDTYEIAISNQAIQILYHLARRMEGVGVERAYLPWVDAIAEMRRAGRPSPDPGDAGRRWPKPIFWASRFSTSSTTRNLLEMLDLADIPFMRPSAPRSTRWCSSGGPACANFAPISRFVDAVAVGDGEELFPEILAGDGRGKTPGSVAGRDQAPARARSRASSCPGVSAGSGDGRWLAAGGCPVPGVVPGAAGRRRARSCLGGGHARMHPRLPLLPGGDVVPAGAGAPRRPRCSRWPATSCQRPDIRNWRSPRSRRPITPACRTY